ncbi:MAG: hypothetical protein PGN30_13080 [Mycolicibacterium neoaurum]|uniref:hypothetical protein n=1 Tax=Mycolicibacterium neoaurum TaxID=1795 RepID=UPI002FF91823
MTDSETHTDYEPQADEFQPEDGAVDHLTLRFVGQEADGEQLHELRAAHVAEVLQGLVGLTSDFDKAGVFHEEGPASAEVLVRPAKEGSFVLEVVRIVVENWDTVKATADTAAVAAGATGAPTLSAILWWSTKSMRAEVKDFTYLENGNVKINWQDDTTDEVPAAAWKELQTRKRRRKKQLRQIMAPLSDPRVTELDVAAPTDPEADTEPSAEQKSSSQSFILKRADYDAVRPEDEIRETSDTFEIQARMSAIDFDDPTKWRVKPEGRARTVTVTDEKFLRQVAQGMAITPQDTFSLRVREDATEKNGRTTTKWVVEKVDRLRRAGGGDESQAHGPSET